MVQILCCSCGVEFHIPNELNQSRVKDKAKFWCPNGHGQSYTGETEAKKLQRIIDQKSQQLANVEAALQGARLGLAATENQLRAVKAAKTKLRKKLHPEEFQPKEKTS